MTQEEFDKAPLLDQILYDTTGMLVENHSSIVEAMEKYHQAKLKLLGIADVKELLIDFCDIYAEGQFEDPDDTEGIVDWYLKVKDN